TRPRPPDGGEITGVPSGVQVGSDSASAGSVLPRTSNSGLPPDEEISRIFQGCENCTSMNAILEPSGDQRGSYVRTGGNVSCILLLPSTRLRHRVMSG